MENKLQVGLFVNKCIRKVIKIQEEYQTKNYEPIDKIIKKKKMEVDRKASQRYNKTSTLLESSWKKKGEDQIKRGWTWQ